MAIQANEVAAQNRLTISVKVNYTNTIDESQNFSQTFRIMLILIALKIFQV